jgi:thymidylate synthase
MVVQRSADLFIGLPVNIASYALLLKLIARDVGMEPGELIFSLGDSHIYSNHLDQVGEQLGREPRGLPQVSITDSDRDVFSVGLDDITLTDYDPYPAIKAPVAV